MSELDLKEEAPEAHTTFSWHARSLDEVAHHLGVDKSVFKVGLSSEEARVRLETFGPNKMTEGVKKTLCRRIYDQVANILVGILAVVAVVSAIRAGTAEDAETVITSVIQVVLIVGVVVINTIIGIVQEGSAEAAAEALKNMLSTDAFVKRDGKEVRIPSKDLVPGDVVFLTTGAKVPADLRMVEVSNVACQEAALTGESVPIDKTVDPIIIDGNPESTPLGDRHNMAFSATLVTQGDGEGIVIATGDHTQIGTINALVRTVEVKKTNVLEQIDFISKWLAVFITLATITTFFLGLFKTGLSPMDSLTIALVCAVGMVPEGLAAFVTMTYAWAVSIMAKQNAIIRSLPAVETLGSVTVICSDKTGTLTQNKMSLIAFVTSNGHYRIDVNAKICSPTNCVRQDTFLSVRTDNLADKPIKQVIDEGPNSNIPRRGKLVASNHFAITNLEKPPPSVHVPRSDDTDNDSPVENGGSPGLAFIRSILSGGILCSRCILGIDGTREGEIGNPTELSILRAAYNAGVDVEGMKEKNPIIAEVPFNSSYKFMATIHEPGSQIGGEGMDGFCIVHVKGAPDSILPLCVYQAKTGNIGETEPIRRNYWTNEIVTLSSHGLRVMALARGVIPKSEINAGDQLGPEFVNDRPDKQWLTMVGLCAIQDPPRPECIDAIVVAHKAGVRVTMITGDHKDTAMAIGETLGLVDSRYPNAITGSELDSMNEDQLKEAVMRFNVFARSSPENKLQIVKALQAQNQVVSMTGDGVNDAPSLKQADMGVAMGLEGTDVAREASDMILADDNFATIVVAVREGRVVWDNLRKVLLINTPINNAQGMSVLFGLAFGLPQSPLTAIQVLFSNLICAVTLGFVCAIEPAEEGIMDLPPRRVGKRLIGRYLFIRIALGTFILIVVVVYGTFWAVWNGYTVPQQRAVAFNTLDFGAISVCLSCRFAYNSSIHPRIFRGNPFCWWSVSIVVALQVAITYIPGLNNVIFELAPMDGPMWLITFLGMVVTFLTMEAEKALRRFLRDRGSDTDDRKVDLLFDENVVSDGRVKIPKGASRLGLEELKS